MRYIGWNIFCLPNSNPSYKVFRGPQAPFRAYFSRTASTLSLALASPVSPICLNLPLILYSFTSSAALSISSSPYARPIISIHINCRNLFKTQNVPPQVISQTRVPPISLYSPAPTHLCSCPCSYSSSPWRRQATWTPLPCGLGSRSRRHRTGGWRPTFSVQSARRRGFCWPAGGRGLLQRPVWSIRGHVRSMWGGCGERVGTGLRTVFWRELRSARTWASWSDSGEEDMAFLSAGVRLEWIMLWGFERMPFCCVMHCLRGKPYCLWSVLAGPLHSPLQTAWRMKLTDCRQGFLPQVHRGQTRR